MAIVNPTDVVDDVGTRNVVWADMDNGDTGAPVGVGAFYDATVQLTGTLSTGGEMTLQGTNEGTVYATLTDLTGVAIVLTALGLKGVLEEPAQIRPNITNGDGSTDLTVSMSFKKPV